MPPVTKYSTIRLNDIQNATMEPEYVKENLEEILASVKAQEYHKVGVSNRGVPIYITADNKHYFALSAGESKHVHYFNKVQHTSQPGIGADLLIQTLVWKSPEADKYHFQGIAAEVMISFMLSDVKQLGSDILQTKDGRRFWISLLEDCIESSDPKLYVYVYDKRYSASQGGPKLLELTYKDDLENLSIWGSADDMKKVRLLISKTKLTSV